MALYGIIAFIIYGWVEFEAMAHVVDGIGGLLAFLGIFVTAIIGIRLLRTQSAIVMAQFRADMAKGEMNSTAIASSLSLLAGAILMLIPGYVTDLLGILCFVPGLRAIIGAFIAKRMSANMMKNSSRFQNAGFGGFHDFHNNAPHHGSADEAAHPHSTPHPSKDKSGIESGIKSGSDIIEGEFKEK